jgi:hypothetical protein
MWNKKQKILTEANEGHEENTTASESARKDRPTPKASPVRRGIANLATGEEA